MTEYSYKAKDRRGRTRTGTVQASSRSQASTQLRAQGLLILGMKSKGNTESVSSFWARSFVPAPRSVDMELSLQQLAMMLRGGMTLLDALRQLSDQASRKSLGKIWEDISSRIQHGASFSDALSQHDCFPEFVIQLAQVGERTGELPPVLERAVKTLSRRRKGTQDLVSALVYPVLVILLAIAVSAYMIVYLIPRLEVYLQSLGKSIPAMTQQLVAFSSWLRDYYPVLAIFFVTSGLGVFLIYRSPQGRLWFDRFVLRLPLLGHMIRLHETSSFARSLSIMLGSGITLIDGLGTAQKLVNNRFTAQTVGTARERIIKGDNFSEAIDRGSAFSPMLKKMVAVGQQSGDLKTVLSEVAEFQEDQFRALVKRLNAVITPALTVGVGGIVGYVYIAFFVALLAAGS